MSENEKLLSREDFVKKAIADEVAAAAKKGTTLSSDKLESIEESANREYNVKEKQVELDGINGKRTGKGTRLQVGQTRGKNPQLVVWEAFDESQPTTLPVTVTEFLKLSGIADMDSEATREATMISYLIDGYNAQAYTGASDPIKEFVNPAWDEDTQKQFRIAVKNYAAAMQALNPAFTLDEAANLIKPGIEKAFAAKA